MISHVDGKPVIFQNLIKCVFNIYVVTLVRLGAVFLTRHLLIYIRYTGSTYIYK